MSEIYSSMNQREWHCVA